MLRTTTTLAFAAATGIAAAAPIDVTWTGDGDGLTWSDPFNWDLEEAPCGLSAHVRIDDDPALESWARLIGPCTIDRLTIDLGDVVEIASRQSLAVVEGPIDNSGILFINAQSGPTTFVIGDPFGGDEISLMGGGEVVLSENVNNRVVGAAADHRLINVDNVMRGSGQVGLDFMKLHNLSIVRADGAVPLVIDARDGVGGFVNQGTLEACDSATMAITDSDVTNDGVIRAITAGVVRLVDCTIANESGEIRAEDASTIELNGAHVTGGAITTVGSGVVYVPNSRSARLSQTITIPTKIRQAATVSNTYVYIDDHCTLTGGGRFVMTDSPYNRLLGLSGSGIEILTIAPDFTVEGAGSLGFNGLGIVVQGTVRANAAVQALVLDPSSAGLINEGVIEAIDGGRLELAAGTYDNSAGTFHVGDGSEIALRGHVIEPAFAIDGTGRVVVENSTSFTIEGDLTTAGTLEQGATVGNTYVYLDGDSTWTGGGRLVMSDSPFNRVLGLSGSGVEILTIAPDFTVEGAGSLGFDGLGIVVQGTVRANAAVQALVLDPSGAGLINDGVIEAIDGGRLELAAGTYDNSAGTFHVGDGSEIALRGHVVEPAFTVDGTGRVVIENNAAFTIEGDLTTAGTLEQGATIGNTYVYLDGDSTWTGGGRLVMSDSPFNRVLGLSGSGVEILTIAPDFTVEGAGSLGFNGVGIVNRGTIIATMPNSSLVIDAANNATGFRNEGMLHAQGLAPLIVASGPFVSSGTILVDADRRLERTGDLAQTAGFTDVRGTFDLTGNLDLLGGTITGDGTIEGTLRNGAGRVAPGATSSTLLVDGTYHQDPAGRFAVSFGAAGMTSLAVTGSVSLAGTLEIAIEPGFTPVNGVAYPIVEASEIVGTFDAVDTCENISLDYTDTGVTVTFGAVSGGATGDVNGNGAVGFDDLLLVLGAWGACDECCPADVDGDGVVALGDLLLVLTNWS